MDTIDRSLIAFILLTGLIASVMVSTIIAREHTKQALDNACCTCCVKE